MKLVDWSMQGVEFANCNCAIGCPCQFNALPTHGNCRAHTFVQIDKGRFGNVKLDGLRWGIMAMWPGPIHLGNGTFQAIVDERLHAFRALNAAAWRDGAFVDVADGAASETPLHVVYVATGGPTATAAFPRTLVRLGKGARATVVVTYAALGDGAHVAIPVTEVSVGDGATCDLATYGVHGKEALHVGACGVALGRGARARLADALLGGRLARHEIDLRLDGSGAEATLDGLFCGRGDACVDVHTTVDHAAPHGTSRQLVKGVLADAARGVFHGRILIRPGADGSDAGQVNRNLLCSDAAQVHTTPALEIRAHDVKCNHGAAIGQLDADAVFYCPARGIGAAAARQILTHAFVREVADRVACAPLRAALDGWLRVHLPGGVPEGL